MSIRPLPLLALGLLIAVIGVVHVGSLRRGHGWGDDFAQYVHHAKNLAEGVPYAETGYVYNPGYPQIGPPAYPPVTPALIAPFYRAFGLDLEAMKLLMIGCLLAFLAIAAVYFRGELPWGAVAALVALLGLNHYFLDDASIGSDLPFLVFLYLALLLVQEGERAAGRPRRRTACYLAAGAAAWLCFGTRTVGFVVLPAAVGADLLRFRRVTRPSLLACAVFGVLAAVQTATFGSGGRYLDQLSADVPALVHNASGYAVQLAAFWRNGYSKPAAGALCAVVSALSAVGFVGAVRRGAAAREVFVLFYLGVVLLWPSYQGFRFLGPVAPLWLFYAMKGLGHPWLAGWARLRLALAAGLGAAAAATYAAQFTVRQYGPLPEGVTRAESVELFDYVRAHTRPDDVIVFVKPRAMALFTQRRCSVYHQPARDEELWDYFGRIGARYLVVVRRDAAMQGAERDEVLEYLRGFAARNRDRLAPVWANEDFAVYEITRP